MDYNVSAVNLINLLTEDGMYEPSNIDEYLEKYEKEHKINIPGSLREFMKAAYMHPILRTADVWVQGNGPEWYFLYEEIQEMLDEDMEEYLKDEESDYHIFAKTPKEKWGELVSDYLNVGSDYAAGVVTYGIKEEDLNKDNPPIFFQHEEDPITQWEKLFESVSDYLLYVICDALLGVFYSTAQSVLEEYEWKFESYEYNSLDEASELFEKYEIDSSKLYKVKTMFPADWQSERIVCGQDNLVIVVKIENSEVEVVVISKG